jgi:hypothetical protein
VSVPRINGLEGADIFDVHVSPAGTQGRSIHIDGDGEPLGLKGDVLRVHYTAKGANTKWVLSGPKSGKINIDYLPHLNAIDFVLVVAA